LEKITDTISIFCQYDTRDASRKPTTKSDLKGENTMEYKLGKIAII